MQRSRSARLLALASALTIPMLVVAVLVPGVASAKTAKPKPVKGSCSTLSGNVAGTVTVSGCTPSPNAPGTGVFHFTGATSGTSSISWSNGSTTTFSFTTKLTDPDKTKKGVSVHNPKFHCAATDLIQVALKGKIPTTGNTGLPSGDTGLKGSIKATICVTSTENLSLLPGTSMAL
jgi:hypothetical protein